jgi:predicted ATPase/class 3 adenylate cyclase
MAVATMSANPAETRTFLLTDIEGSTNLLRALGERYESALVRHREILRGTAESHDGEVIDSYADGFFAAFGRAADAVTAAVEGLRMLADEPWADGVQLTVRIGIHSGSAVRSGDAWVGLDVHKVARIMAAAHGGQILVSEAAAALLADDLPAEFELLDLGSRRLKDLSRPETLFQVEAPGLATGFDAPRTVDQRANNLPFQSTPFVGREDDLAEAAGLLRSSRLLTLTGAGGAGKTRLALQLAAESIDQFRDGVFLVQLAAVTDPDYLPAAIANELEIRADGSAEMLQLLQWRLETRNLLLVLDNFEQIVDAATTVTSLLQRCRELTIVVTSREPLRVTGEQEYRVRPLGVPDLGDLGPAEALSRCEAVELFVQRSHAVSPDFRLTERNAPAVAQLCVKLDGLPLSIELAAARMKVFTPATLLARLDKRIRVLSGGARDVPERQQTLRKTLDWSYNLLDDDEKTLFTRLGVFVGRFSIDAAELVCGSDMLPELDLAIVDGIESLVNKSLLRAAEGELDGQLQLWMLETIREYATELLAASAEESQVRTAHASFFADLAEQFMAAQSDPENTREEDVRWIRMIAAAHENINAALEWTTGPGVVSDAFRLVGNMTVFYGDQGLWREGAAWLDRLAGRETGVDPRHLMNVHHAAAHAAWHAGDWRTARNEGLAAARFAREAGKPDVEVMAKFDALLPFEPDEGTFEERDREVEELIESARKVTGSSRPALGLGTRGSLRLAYGRFDEAAAVFREMLELRGSAANHGILILLGHCELRLGRTAEAERMFRRVLEEERDGSTSPGTIAVALLEMAALSRDPVRAVRLLGASDAIRVRTGRVQEPLEQREYDRVADQLSSAFPADEYERIRNEGSQMKLEAAVEYALSGDPGA